MTSRRAAPRRHVLKKITISELPTHLMAAIKSQWNGVGTGKTSHGRTARTNRPSERTSDGRRRDEKTLGPLTNMDKRRFRPRSSDAGQHAIGLSLRLDFLLMGFNSPTKHESVLTVNAWCYEDETNTNHTYTFVGRYKLDINFCSPLVSSFSKRHDPCTQVVVCVFVFFSREREDIERVSLKRFP